MWTQKEIITNADDGMKTGSIFRSERRRNVSVPEREKTYAELADAAPGGTLLERREERWLRDLRAACGELFELLEEYGPSWYTEEHHKHAVAALFDRNSSRMPSGD